MSSSSPIIRPNDGSATTTLHATPVTTTTSATAFKVNSFVVAVAGSTSDPLMPSWSFSADANHATTSSGGMTTNGGGGGVVGGVTTSTSSNVNTVVVGGGGVHRSSVDTIQTPSWGFVQPNIGNGATSSSAAVTNASTSSQFLAMQFLSTSMGFGGNQLSTSMHFEQNAPAAVTRRASNESMMSRQQEDSSTTAQEDNSGGGGGLQHHSASSNNMVIRKTRSKLRTKSSGHLRRDRTGSSDGALISGIEPPSPILLVHNVSFHNGGGGSTSSGVFPPILQGSGGSATFVPETGGGGLASGSSNTVATTMGLPPSAAMLQSPSLAGIHLSHSPATSTLMMARHASSDHLRGGVHHSHPHDLDERMSYNVSNMSAAAPSPNYEPSTAGGGGGGGGGTRKLKMLSPEEIKRMKNSFDKYDINNCGSIPSKNVVKLLRDIGHAMPASKAKSMLRQVDANQNGLLEFDEFLQLVLIFKGVAQFRIESTPSTGRSSSSSSRSSSSSSSSGGGNDEDNDGAAGASKSSKKNRKQKIHRRRKGSSSMKGNYSKDETGVTTSSRRSGGGPDNEDEDDEEDDEAYHYAGHHSTQHHIAKAISRFGAILPDASKWSWVLETCRLFLYMYIFCSVTTLHMRSLPEDVWEQAHYFTWVDVGITPILLAEMILSCFTSFRRSEDGVWTQSYKEITIHYLQTYFIPDLISLLPLRLFVNDDNHHVVVMMILAHFRLFRLARTSLLFPTSNQVGMTRHYIAFYFVAVPLTLGITAFLCAVHVYSVIWIRLLADQRLNYGTGVFITLYYLSGVGYGGFEEQTMASEWWSNVCTLSALFINAAVIGNIVNFMNQADIEGSRQSKLVETQAVLRFFGVPQTLQEEILQYQNHILTKDIQASYSGLMDRLPAEIRANLQMQLQLHLIIDVPLFRNAHETVKIALVQQLRSVVCCPEEFLIVSGETAEDIIFISHGFVDLVDCNGMYLTTLRNGRVFADSILFAPRGATVVHELSAKSLGYSEILILGIEALWSVLELFPAFAADVREYGRRHHIGSFAPMVEGADLPPTVMPTETQMAPVPNGDEFTASRRRSTVLSSSGNSLPLITTTRSSPRNNAAARRRSSALNPFLVSSDNNDASQGGAGNGSKMVGFMVGIERSAVETFEEEDDDDDDREMHHHHHHHHQHRDSGNDAPMQQGQQQQQHPQDKGSSRSGEVAAATFTAFDETISNVALIGGSGGGGGVAVVVGQSQGKLVVHRRRGSLQPSGATTTVISLPPPHQQQQQQRRIVGADDLHVADVGTPDAGEDLQSSSPPPSTAQPSQTQNAMLSQQNVASSSKIAFATAGALPNEQLDSRGTSGASSPLPTTSSNVLVPSSIPGQAMASHQRTRPSLQLPAVLSQQVVHVLGGENLSPSAANAQRTVISELIPSMGVLSTRSPTHRTGTVLPSSSTGGFALEAGGILLDGPNSDSASTDALEAELSALEALIMQLVEVMGIEPSSPPVSSPFEKGN